jgi:TatA/E family protein of Tat protein translocase
MILAFLNLGASEIILILLVLLLLFGADKAPALARSLGRARAKLDSAKGQFTQAIRTEEERAWDEQLAFERERERKMAEAAADPEREALARAAEQLGLQTQGLGVEELRAAVRARLGEDAPAR